MLKNHIKISLYCIVFVVISTGAYATENFNTWVAGVKAEAISQGMSADVVNAAMASANAPIPRIIELDRKQPEGKMTFAKYKKRVINQARIDQGRRLYKEHAFELQKASAKYGVPAQYIVALWGLETSYGNNTGGFGVIPALATMAHDGRRSSFFRKELMKALKILDEGHIDLAHFKGSWAGAMGQNQFMPSSFHAYAVDGNNDGRRDIWTSLPDVFHSTAKYLGTSGWKEDEKWGRRVTLPASFPNSLASLKVKKPIQHWAGMGVTLPGGGALPQGDLQASIVTPDGVGGDAFMVYGNYRVIMKWNKSTYFASTVGILADAIAAGR
jgi:membrane-bound lytic murein transglycosylase B